MNSLVQLSLDRLARVAKHPLEEYRNFITAELCNVSHSTLSYFATLEQNLTILHMIGWSRSAMINCGMIGDKPIIYKVAETGLWGDAVRERKPVITNDYPNLVKATKKGYPQGHVNVRRHMNLPIYEGKQMVLVVGVGNKTEPYTLDDAAILTELMVEVWKTLKTRLA